MLAAPSRPRCFVKARLDADTRDQLIRLARAHDRSLAAEIRRAIDAYVRLHAATLGEVGDGLAA